jgi:hypothetical protein
MHVLLQNLLQLQTLEFGNQPGGEAKKEIAELRGKIPAPILGHYDRLAVRGKKGVAIVRNQVCTGCHMQLPTGTITTLMRREDLQLCDSCGRYLFLPDPEPVAPEVPAKAVALKPAKKKRKAKTPPAE